MSRAAPDATPACTGVLFVCLGNICRSPLAEGIFTHLATERRVLERFDVDSCGTGGWHAGETADGRSIAVARTHGIRLARVARQLEPARDFPRFELLIAMDRSNAASLVEAGAPPTRVRLVRRFDPSLPRGADPDVPDPYHWPGDGFEEVYRMLERACRGLLEALLRDPGASGAGPRSLP